MENCVQNEEHNAHSGIPLVWEGVFEDVKKPFQSFYFKSDKYNRIKSLLLSRSGTNRSIKFDSMASVRQNKAGRLILKELSLLFQKETRNLFDNTMISVTVVRMSPDLKVAKVYLSFFNVPDNEALLKDVRKQHSNLRRLLGFEMKNQLRFIPELHFYLDDSLDYAEEIDSLLNND